MTPKLPDYAQQNTSNRNLAFLLGIWIPRGKVLIL